MKIRTYYVDNCTRRSFKSAEGTFKELTESFFKPHHVFSKNLKQVKRELPAIIAAKIQSNTLSRSTAKPIDINFFILDIDGLPKDLPKEENREYIDKLKRLLEEVPYNHIRYNTVSYRYEDPRYRIIFPVEGKFNPLAYPSINKAIAEHLFPGIQIDECSFNIKQLMFLPRAEISGVRYTNPHTVAKTDGNYIDIDLLGFMSKVTASPAATDSTDSDNYDLLVAMRNKPTDIPSYHIGQILSYLPPDCNYRQWRNVGLALKHEGQTSTGRNEEMESLFVDWSKGEFHDNLTPANFTSKEDTIKVFESFNPNPSDPNIAPITLRSLQYEAAKKGYVPPPSSMNEVYAQKLNDWVFLYGTDVFYNTELKVQITRSAFNAVFAHLVKDLGSKSIPSTYLASNGIIENYNDLLYVPTSNPEKSVTIDRIPYVNSYVPPDTAEPTTDEYQTVHNTINDIKSHLNDTVWPGEAYILFDMIAHLNQKPEQRICWMPLLQGPQGIGKSFFVVLAQCSIGEQNVNIISSDSITSTFSSWSSGALLNIIEELSISSKERRGAYNKIKQYITGDRINVNQKYAPERNITNRTSYVATTNLIDSVRPEQDDRRLFVLHSPLSPVECKKLRDSNFFSSKFDKLRSNKKHVREYFLKYPISAKFNLIDLPFQTRGSLAIKKATRSPLQVKLGQIATVYLKGTKTISVEHIVFILENVMRYRLKKFDEQNLMSVLIQEHGYRITDSRLTVYGVIHDILTIEGHGTELDWEERFREDLKIIKGNIEEVRAQGNDDKAEAYLPRSDIFV